jgi:type IV secretion system protein VirD4
MFNRKPAAPPPAPTSLRQEASARQVGIYYGCNIDGERAGAARFFKGDEHFLLIGPTRSGKGRSILAPNLILDCSRSAIVVDPKGELANWTADHRKAQGHEVIYLDPFGVLGDMPQAAARARGFNPLLALDPTRPEFLDDVMSATEAIVQVKPNEKDPHWAESAQDFVAGITMDEIGRKGRAASYSAIRQLISKDDIEIGTHCETACMEPLHPLIPNKLARFIPLSNPKAEGNRELASMISNARTQTRFLDSPLIAASVANGTDNDGVAFDFGRMKKELITVYLVIPPAYLVTHAKWLRLILDAAIRAIQRVPKKDSRFDVLFMLDEFCQYGRLNSIETSIALNAGYGIKIFAVVQSLAQLKHLYSDNWETIVSGGVVASFGPRDYFTSEYLAKLTGQSLREMQATSVSARGGPSFSNSPQYHYTKMPHELRQMPRGKMLAFVPTAKGGQTMRETLALDFTQLNGSNGLPDVTRHMREPATR